jgi:hypothetical protein
MLPFQTENGSQAIFLIPFIYRLLIVQTEVRHLSVCLRKKPEVIRLQTE